MTRKILVRTCAPLLLILLAVGSAQAQGAPDRSGFTIGGSLGVGIQNDTALEESAVGLAGINLGLGGFVNERTALLFRFSGTNVSYDFGGFGDFRQVSGTAGPVVQLWLSDRVNVEAGAGFGFWSAEDESEQGFGLLLGTGVSILRRGRHNLQVGVEYAPAFTDPGTIHNIGITLGYQFF